ncbi:MAG: CPBP family intramembrane metalloprotease [Thermoproteota archaeon]|nr:CPBP family intramembrane metalloprotease [Thermoproteota archaeon]
MLRPLAERFTEEIADFHPRSWLSKYRRTSIGYLTKMLLFYHGIGILLLLAITPIIEQILPDYEQPSVPRSLLAVLAAGPLEETIFFGIPFYIFGNAYSVLVTGVIWVGIHLLNTDTLSVNSLAFGNLVFVLPSLFFSLRTWISGKGWFSVITHSAWNGIFFSAGCSAGEYTCTAIERDLSATAMSVALSVVLVGVTYVLYKRKENKDRKRLRSDEFNI